MNKITIQIKKVNTMVMSAMLFAVSCQGQSSSNANEAKPPKVDIHTALLLTIIEAVKQHIKAGTTLNAKDPMGSSSPLITATVFNFDCSLKVWNEKRRKGSLKLTAILSIIGCILIQLSEFKKIKTSSKNFSGFS